MNHDLDIQIAVWPAVGAAFTFAGYPQLLPGLNAGRDLDVDAHAFMFITLAAALGAFFTDFLTRAAAVRADTLGLEYPERRPLLRNDRSGTVTRPGQTVTSSLECAPVPMH